MPRFNKTAWVRAQPTGMSAKELIALAKNQGIQLTAQNVYMARYEAKKAGKVKRAKTAEVAPKKAKPSRRLSKDSDLQQTFVLLVVRIGTDEAQRLLDGLRA